MSILCCSLIGAYQLANVAVYTNLSGKEPHRQLGMDRVITIYTRERITVMVRILAQKWQDV